MKLLVMSDLHLEMGVMPRIPAEMIAQADLLVLAGDIHNGTAGFAWAREIFPAKPIVYVAGNHEFFDGDLEEVQAALHAEAPRYDITYLEQSEAELLGLRFLGCCLWTDYQLYGTEKLEEALAIGRRIMVDYRAIGYRGRRLRAEDTISLHQQAKAWLREHLAMPSALPTIVITHHLPSFACVAERFRQDLGSGGFASRLDDLVRLSNLWICGHTHDAFDITLDTNGTGRIVCNPRGYVRDSWRGRRVENPHWQPRLIEI